SPLRWSAPFPPWTSEPSMAKPPPCQEGASPSKSARKIGVGGLGVEGALADFADEGSAAFPPAQPIAQTAITQRRMLPPATECSRRRPEGGKGGGVADCARRAAGRNYVADGHVPELPVRVRGGRDGLSEGRREPPSGRGLRGSRRRARAGRA